MTLVTAPGMRTADAPAPGRGGRLLGTGRLLRLALRRDRLLLPAWGLAFALMAGVSASATAGLYPEQAQRLEAANLVNGTASLVALYGRIYDPSSEGALAMFKLTSFGAAMLAILMVIVVVRHTRKDEETGRAELLGSAAVGRDAPLAAALLLGFGASLAIGAATAVALVAGGLPVGGSVAFGAGWAGSGIAFAAVAGVCAQVTQSTRTATGLGLVAVATAYLLRAVGDLAADAPGFASWLSPIGWTQQVRAYAGEQWWVLLLPVLAALVLVPLAFALRSRRDLASGFLADRPGPALGRLRSVTALAWRLQRGVLLAWLAGFVVFGFLFGSVADSIEGFFSNPTVNEILAQLGGAQALTDAFLAAELGLAGVVAAAYGVAAALHLRAAEVDGHAEVVLATAVPRWRWAAPHLGVALVGTAALLLVAGLMVGVGFGVATGEWHRVGELAVAGLARVPAAWVMVGVAFATFGWAPRAAAAAWGVFAAAVVLGEFGPLWNAPQWLMNLSPFVHSPLLPSATADLGALVPLAVVATLLVALGFAGWRRRDVPA
jgi:ABC-2 type transport system permease protein